jgi:integrase
MAVDELHDLDNPGTALWTIPAHRMKARKAHLVPLPPLAREIITTEIESRARPEFVFASKYSRRLKLSRNALSESLAGLINKLDDAAGASLKADPPTPHDLRRSVATGLAKLGIVREDRLAVLAHSHNDVHDIHYDHYDRLPQKRAALEMWERHLRKVIADQPQTDARVLPLWR